MAIKKKIDWIMDYAPRLNGFTDIYILCQLRVQYALVIYILHFYQFR